MARPSYLDPNDQRCAVCDKRLKPGEWQAHVCPPVPDAAPKEKK